MKILLIMSVIILSPQLLSSMEQFNNDEKLIKQVPQVTVSTEKVEVKQPGCKPLEICFSSPIDLSEFWQDKENIDQLRKTIVDIAQKLIITHFYLRQEYSQNPLIKNTEFFKKNIFAELYNAIGHMITLELNAPLVTHGTFKKEDTEFLQCTKINSQVFADFAGTHKLQAIMLETVVRVLALKEHLKLIDYQLAKILKNSQTTRQSYVLLYNHLEKMHAFLKEIIVMLKKCPLPKRKNSL